MPTPIRGATSPPTAQSRPNASCSVSITGAAKGIGRACAELFAREGARLVLNDVDESGLQQTAASLGDGVEVVTVLGDASVEEDARRIVAAGVESFGVIDSLVANAGPASTTGSTAMSGRRALGTGHALRG